jgi:hypothetical protein
LRGRRYCPADGILVGVLFSVWASAFERLQHGILAASSLASATAVLLRLRLQPRQFIVTGLITGSDVQSRTSSETAKPEVFRLAVEVPSNGGTVTLADQLPHSA